MIRSRFAPILPLAVAAVACVAEPPARSSDEAAVREVVRSLGEAWRSGSGEAWAAHFSEDADFTVWFGLRMNGREEIALGHQMIFDGFYAGTSFEMEVVDLSFPADDIAIALLEGRVARGDVVPNEPEVAPMAVLRRSDAGWEIVAFQNTPYAVQELRQNGDIAQFREFARSVSPDTAG